MEQGRGNLKVERAKATQSRVRTFNSTASWKKHFEEAKTTGKLIVIDFSATWCGPCRLMEPIVIGFSEKYTDVEFVKIDVDKLSEVAQEFGVEAMPTFLL